MKLLTTFFISFSFFLQISCETDFKEINKKLQALNDELCNESSTSLDTLESFAKNLVAALADNPSMSIHISKLEALAAEYKAISWPFFENLKTCKDLKLQVSSTLVHYNKLKFTKLKNKAITYKFSKIYLGIQGFLSKNRTSMNDKVRQAMNQTGVSLWIMCVSPLEIFFNPQVNQEFSKVTKILQMMSQHFKSDLKKLIDEKIKACPTKISSTDL